MRKRTLQDKIGMAVMEKPGLNKKMLMVVTYQNKCQKLEISREIVLRFGKCRESPKSQGKS